MAQKAVALKGWQRHVGQMLVNGDNIKIKSPLVALQSCGTCPAGVAIRAGFRAALWEHMPSARQRRQSVRNSSTGADDSRSQSNWVVEGSDAWKAQPPTEKQLEFAKRLARERGVTVPVAVEHSRHACSEFISKIVKPNGSLAAAPSQGAGAAPSQGASGSVLALQPREKQKPSAKQIKYAFGLAAESGHELPPDAQECRIACSEFIDQIVQVVPPSKKQVKFAESLAHKHNRGRLPEDTLRSRKLCSEYIIALERAAIFGKGGFFWVDKPSKKDQTAVPPAGTSADSTEFDTQTLAVLGKLAAATNAARPSLYQLLMGVLAAQERSIDLPANALGDVRPLAHPTPPRCLLPCPPPLPPLFSSLPTHPEEFLFSSTSPSNHSHAHTPQNHGQLHSRQCSSCRKCSSFTGGSVLQCVAKCCSVSCRVLQCVAVCCSLLQCVAVCSSFTGVFTCVFSCVLFCHHHLLFTCVCGCLHHHHGG